MSYQHEGSRLNGGRAKPAKEKINFALRKVAAVYREPLGRSKNLLCSAHEASKFKLKGNIRATDSTGVVFPFFSVTYSIPLYQ